MKAHLFFVFEALCLIEKVFFAENLLGEFVASKAEVIAEMTFSLVWWVHVVSVTLLNHRIVRFSAQKRFLVLLVRFLRRCMFYVVSLISRFETAPDFNASKHISFDFY